MVTDYITGIKHDIKVLERELECEGPLKYTKERTEYAIRTLRALKNL